MTAHDRHVRELKDRWIAAALIAIPTVVFARSLAGDFLNWDDWKYVAGNLDLRPDHWPAIITYWYQPHIRLFIPVTFSAYAALEFIGVYFAGSVQPWVFHAGNLLIHIASGLLLWKLLARLFGDVRIAAAAAGLFLLHPVQVEAVCWISNLNTLLGGFLAIVTLWFYVCSIGEPRSRRTRACFIIACITTVLALLAKPSACVLPIVAWAIHRAADEHDSRRAGIRFIILSAMVMPMIWVAHHLQADVATYIDVPWARRPLVALDALGFYVLKVFAPIHLAFDYGRAPAKISPGLPALIGTLLLLSLLATLAFRSFRRHRWVVAGLLIFVAALMPILGIVPFDFQFYSTVADRYLYLPMVGLSIIVAAALQKAASQSRNSRIACFSISGIVLLVFAILSFIQAGVWASDGRLFGHALLVNPQSVAANQTLGFLAAQAADQSAGDPRRHDQLLALALDYDRRALAQNPNNPRVEFNRANLLLKMGHPDQSLADYTAAAGQLEDEARLQNNWGVACLQLQQPNEALQHFRLAIDANSGFVDALANAGLAYLVIGRQDLARQSFVRALSIDPHQPQALRGMQRISALPR